MDYAALVDVYERLKGVDSTLEKRDVLAEAFAAADDEHLPWVVTLVQGHLFAAWQRAELGVSSSLTTRAIAKATGVGEDEIEERWRETGDLGDAAWAAENETQQTLVTTDLTVRTVVDTLRELATYEGEGSQGRRIDAIARLLSDATPREARYVTRTALGHLRIGVAFDAERSGPETDLEAGDALVLPTGTKDLAFVDAIVEETGALKAGFSGWAIDSAFRYRGDYDATFALSDHCDFSELVEVVERVGPEVVYTHHGFADEFATYLTGLGYESRALKRNQTALGDF